LSATAASARRRKTVAVALWFPAADSMTELGRPTLRCHHHRRIGSRRRRRGLRRRRPLLVYFIFRCII
jgi:hypothetical protein